MSTSWAISGVDLHLDLTGPRIRAGLERALRDAVQTGRLAPGTRLPSSRALSADLGIARNTVAEVYGQLVAEGWLAARQGSGTVVANRPGGTSLGDVARDRDTAAGPARAPELADPAARYDLKPGSPDLSAFPRSEWAAAARRALAAAPSAAFGYGDPAGAWTLRESLARYLARARGVRTDPGRIVVCAGYVHALALVCTVLARRGAIGLAVEQFGLTPHHRVAEACGLRTVPIDVDAAGARTDRLVSAHAAAVLLTPAHQFPLGVVLAPDRRYAAVEWATSTGGVVIEDDYDGEFRYDRQPVGALQSLAPEHVVYTGTASKSLAPGLRLGWAMLPGDLVEPVIAAKQAAGIQPGIVGQLTLAEFIESGGYDRHVRRSRHRYRRRRDRLVAALGERAPRVRVSGVAAGLHAVVELPAADSVGAVVARAERHGLYLDGLGRYAHPGADDAPPALVVGYGAPPDHAFAGALDALCRSLAA
jgi:GntR family transcriptional regulator / MocR family aminotransferase